MAQLCPRCGSKLSFIRETKIGSRSYYYGEHRQDGKRWSCYLGPRDYSYVTKTHLELALGRVPLILKGPLDRERILEYLGAILDQISGDQVLRSKAARMIRDWIQKFGA